MDTAPARADLGHWTGSKYQEQHDVKEIAKLIRRDIKAAGLPGKIGVRISRYSMGQSITIDAVTPFATHHGDVTRENLERSQGIKCPWMTREGHALYEALEKIGNAYNYDRSDLTTDYFDSAFHLYVNVSSLGW